MLARIFYTYFVTTLVGIAFFSALAPSVYAQKSGTDPLFVDVQPQSPAPGVSTTITIDSSTVDLSQATIRWTLNGSPAAAGAGVRTFTFTMGVAGKVTVVGLTVVPLRGSAFTRTFSFRPGVVTLLWEADTYIPPFFKGKALYTPGATIRVLALPQVTDSSGKPIAAGDLTFKWKINGDAYADRSGLGRDVLSWNGSTLGGEEEISVDVFRKDGLKAASGAVFIKDGNPLVRFYKRDPLRGTLYAHALGGNEPLSEAETTIVAEPYYISGQSRNNAAFQYTWTLNGKEITPQGGDPAVLTLRQTGTQAGNATLTFAVQNTDPHKILQAAEAAVTLVLGNSGSSFFNF